MTNSTESHALLTIIIISMSPDIVRFTNTLMKPLSHALVIVYCIHNTK